MRKVKNALSFPMYITGSLPEDLEIVKPLSIVDHTVSYVARRTSLIRSFFGKKYKQQVRIQQHSNWVQVTVFNPQYLELLEKLAKMYKRYCGVPVEVTTAFSKPEAYRYF